MKSNQREQGLNIHLVVWVAFLLSLPAIMSAQVEEFPVAFGKPSFGEQPHIVGNLVAWQRYQGYDVHGVRIPDKIQLKDLSRSNNPVIEAADYPASRIGVVLNKEFLFRGADNAFPEGSPIFANKIADILTGIHQDILVSEFGHPVAASKDFIFIKVSFYEQEPYNKKYFAKAINDLDAPLLESLKLVASFRDQTNQSRTQAASDNYFVWVDREPGIDGEGEPFDTWKVYAKSAQDLFTEGAERLVADTHLPFGSLGTDGVYLDLYDNLLVFQGAKNRSSDTPTGLFLKDLDKSDEPVLIAEAPDFASQLYWPAISSNYIVWTELRGFFIRKAYALRLEDGRPVGEPFPISSGDSGGDWITIDRNVAVWNGSTIQIRDGGVVEVSEAIVAAELPLPGADDVGDVDVSGEIDISDAVIILQYLFLGGWKPRLRLADADRNGAIEMADAIRILRYLFLGEARPGE